MILCLKKTKFLVHYGNLKILVKLNPMISRVKLDFGMFNFKREIATKYLTLTN